MKSTIIRPVPDNILVASIVIAELFGFIALFAWFLILGMPENYSLLMIGITILLITNFVHYHVATIRPAIKTIGVIIVSWLRNKLQRK